MKILYTNFHPRNGGGHVTYVLNLARGLANEHDVTIATPATSRLYRYAQTVPGVRVVDMGFTTRLSSLVRESNALKRLIRENAFDIVHVNGSGDHRSVMFATIGMRKRPRIVFTKHNDHPLNTLGHRLRSRFATDQIIAVSRYVAVLLENSSYRRHGVNIIHHGVDTDYFSPPSASLVGSLRRQFFGADCEGKLLLGSSGGTDIDKGWLDLLAAIALLPMEQQDQFRVLVAGDSPNAMKRDRVRALGMSSKVVFPGLLDDVRPALAACDIGFVLSHREALSFACREQMAMGLPELVSDSGGLPENVTHGVDGWIVPVRNPQAVAQVLAAILADRSRVSVMGHAARQKATREFTLARFAADTCAVYRRTLSN
jgi:glycosyltransferase involved in cell wall biosynthesis